MEAKYTAQRTEVKHTHGAKTKNMRKIILLLTMIASVNTYAQLKPFSAITKGVVNDTCSFMAVKDSNGVYYDRLLNALDLKAYFGATGTPTFQQVLNNGNIATNEFGGQDNFQLSDYFIQTDITLDATANFLHITNGQTRLQNHTIVTDSGLVTYSLGDLPAVGEFMQGLIWVQGAYGGNAGFAGDVHGGRMTINDYANNWNYILKVPTLADSVHIWYPSPLADNDTVCTWLGLQGYVVPGYGVHGGVAVGGKSLTLSVDTGQVTTKKWLYKAIDSAASYAVNDVVPGYGMLTAGTNTVTVTVDTGSITTIGRLYKVVDSGLAIGGFTPHPAGTPTFAFGAAAGTSPSGVGVVGGSDDRFGTIQFTTGTSCPTTGTIFTVTFHTAWAAGGIILLLPEGGDKLSPANATTGILNITAGSTTTFTVSAIGVALANGTTYDVAYYVIPPLPNY